jgi:hypothetical protein
MVIPVIMNKLGDDANLQAETAVENLKRRSKRVEVNKA